TPGNDPARQPERTRYHAADRRHVGEQLWVNHHVVGTAERFDKGPIEGVARQLGDLLVRGKHVTYEHRLRRRGGGIISRCKQPRGDERLRRKPEIARLARFVGGYGLECDDLVSKRGNLNLLSRRQRQLFVQSIVWRIENERVFGRVARGVGPAVEG